MIVLIPNTQDFYIIPVANPDGYQYTWTADRFWFSPRYEQTRASTLTIKLQVQEPAAALVRCQMYWHRHEQKLGEATHLTATNARDSLSLVDHRDTNGNRPAKRMTEFAITGMRGAALSKPLRRTILQTSFGLSPISKFSWIFGAMVKRVSGSMRYCPR